MNQIFSFVLLFSVFNIGTTLVIADLETANGKSKVVGNLLSRLASFTKAGISATGQPDHFVHVSDDSSRLGVDAGTGWQSSAGNVDIRDFGVKGDGIADDTAALRAALSALREGGRLHFPVGVYKVTSTLAIGASNVTISGEGEKSVITGVMTRSSDMKFAATGRNNITISDLTITGTHSWGIFISGGRGHRILHNNISGGTVHDSGGTKGGGIYVENASDVTVDSNTLSGNGSGVPSDEGFFDIQFNFGTYRVVDSRVTNNHCTSKGVGSNIGLYDVFRVAIEGNFATGAMATSNGGYVRGGYGIMLYHTTNVPRTLVGENVVRNNTVHDVQGSGIYLQCMQKTLASNNNIRATGSVQVDTSLGVGGIVLDGSPNSTVSGNQISNSGKDGIAIIGDLQCSPTTGAVISRNTVINSSQNGISIRGLVSDSMIIGNSVSNTHGVAIGMFADAPSQRMLIAGNIISRLTGRGISIGIRSTPTTVGWLLAGNSVTGASDRAYILAGSGIEADSSNTADGKSFGVGIVSRGDENVTLTTNLDSETQLFASALTANRKVTLDTKRAYKGKKWHIVRLGLGPYTLDVGGIRTIPASTAAFVDVEYTGSAWVLTRYGVL